MKFKLTKESIINKLGEISVVVKNNPKKTVALVIGTVTVSAAFITLLANGNSNNSSNNMEQTSEPTTLEELQEEITSSVVTTTSEITIAPEVTTTPEVTTMHDITTIPVSLDEEEIIEEIVVTKQTTPEVTTAPTTTKQTTTTVPTTTKKVTTTSEITIAPEEVEVVKPIKIKNLEKKKKILKDTLLKVGLNVSDDIILNTIRVLHSDYIQHDDFEEITAVKYEQVISLLSTVGSYNCQTFSAKCNCAIPTITEGVYIPVEILPENQQKLVSAVTKLSEIYRKSLNNISTPMFDLTIEELDELDKEVLKDLDESNIKDIETWSTVYSEYYSDMWEEKYNEKYTRELNKYGKNVKTEYKTMFNDVLEIVNSKEYEELTPSTKLIFFTNISGAMISGIPEKSINKYKAFEKTITDAADQTREDLIIANRTNNISQQEALDTIVENKKEYVKQERADLESLDKELENLYDDGVVLVR